MDKLNRVAKLARSAPVELMTHPIVELEFRFLVGPDFEARFQGIQLADYRAL
jgi:hypothetical protein